nr:MAG TPA: hypothetical protein [Caudoviricetes sp.]
MNYRRFTTLTFICNPYIFSMFYATCYCYDFVW